jgi:hypothetical protein
MKMNPITRACIAAALILLHLPLAAQADKTDVATLLNGDDVTGEIKSLEFGELRYSTDSMGTVSIEWEEVVALRSDQALQVEVASGARFFGNLVPASAEGLVAVGLGGNVQELDILKVIRITPIETDEKIWQRLEGSVKFGFDSDKASSVTSGYLNANVRYRARTFLLGLDVSSSFTDPPGDDNTTQNQSLGMNYQRFRDNRWYTDWFASTERNDAQGIDQRLSGGGGLGRYLVQSNTNQLSLLGGLVGTRTSFVGNDPDTTEAEGKLQVRYLHRRNEPSSDITFTTEIYPLLEDFSNFRSNSNLTVRREIIEDLYFDLTFFYNYLSDPPLIDEDSQEFADKDDYGVITSIGYSF